MAKTETTSKVLKDQKDNLTIRSFYQPEGVEKTMLQRVYDRYKAMKDSSERKAAEKEWDRARKQWEALRDDRTDDQWQSNHVVPITTSVIESALSEVIDESPKPLILPRGSEDIPKITVMDHIFDYTWDISDSDLEFEDIIHDAFTEGTGIGQEYFYSDLRKIKTGPKGSSKTEWEEEDMIDYNDCYLECVKNDDFFIDENARSFRGPYGARDCVRRYIMHINDFKQFFKGPTWDPLGNASKVTPGGADTNYYEWYKPPQGIDHSQYVEVLWYWCEKPDDWLCIVANDVMVVLGPNPYKHKKLPFARAVDVKRTHKFYGKGEAAILESIQDELNTLRRMVIDRNHLDIDKMFIGSNRLNLSEEDLIARPHGFIPSDDPNSVKAIEYNDIPRSVELSMNHLEDDATIATGINPRAQALPTAGTATEAAILKESTLKRIRLKVRRIEREFLVRIARLRVSNILQYYKQPKLELIEGEAGTQAYKDQVQKLQDQGLLQVGTDGQNYKKKYREIRLQNKELVSGVDGNFQTNTIQGFSFFEANPEFFLPKRGGYDVKFAAGSTLPISKPLMQSKATEMYDRLIQLAIGVPDTYDPLKLGDYLIKVNDGNPADFHKDQTQTAPADDQQARLQMLIELANTENKLIMNGKDVPATPYAPAAHTLIHVKFTSSPAFQALKKDDPIVKVMIAHVTGEIAAQNERQSGATTSGPQPDPNAQPTQGGQPTSPGATMPNGGSPVPTAQPTAQNGGNAAMTATMPAKIQGGGQVPPAM